MATANVPADEDVPSSEELISKQCFSLQLWRKQLLAYERLAGRLGVLTKDQTQVLATLHFNVAQHSASIQKMQDHLLVGDYCEPVKQRNLNLLRTLHTSFTQGMDLILAKKHCVQCAYGVDRRPPGPLQKCGGCQQSHHYYCSRECQRKDWLLHKPFCQHVAHVNQIQ